MSDAVNKKIEYRLWTKNPNGTIWERWSGGVKTDRDEWVRVANADIARRERNGLPELDYSITKREVIDYEREEI